MGFMCMSVFAVMIDADIFKIQKEIHNNSVFNHLDRCPATSSPKTQLEFSAEFSDQLEKCDENIEACFRQCTENEGIACYMTALIVEDRHQQFTAQQLFQRSCELGVASGCTNRAAGMLNLEQDKDEATTQCITQTFQKTCDWRDPWGCTMYATEVLKQDPSSKKMQEKALNALKNSCLYGEEDDACVYAEDLKRQYGLH